MERENECQRIPSQEKETPLVPETKQIYKGRLDFFAETGTEGGYWALVDERFISKVTPPFGVFGNQTVFDTNNPHRRGKTQESAEVLHKDIWDPLPDPIQKDPDYYNSSLFKGEERGSREADQHLMKKYEFEIKYNTERMDEQYGTGNWHLENPYTVITADGERIFFGSTPRTIPYHPYTLQPGNITKNIVEWEDGEIEERLSPTLLEEKWDYEGLHILKTGDKLTIYDKDNPEKVAWEGKVELNVYPTFTESAFNLWIHDDQTGIDRETWATWFFNENPAKLVAKGKSIRGK